MALFKKVDKVLAALGNIKAMERLHVDTVTETKIENIPGEKIAESDEASIHAGISDLNDYLFLETIVVSKHNIKTFKGATLSFKGGDEFKLTSDTQEIVSDFSNVSKRYMTTISFDITENEIELLRAGNYDTIHFECKKVKLFLNKPAASEKKN